MALSYFSPTSHPIISRRRRKEDMTLSKLKGQGRGKGLCSTYIGFEVTGCRMTWGARVGVSGTGTTSESQRLDSKKPNSGSTTTPKSLIPRRCRQLRTSHQTMSPWGCTIPSLPSPATWIYLPRCTSGLDDILNKVPHCHLGAAGGPKPLA